MWFGCLRWRVAGTSGRVRRCRAGIPARAPRVWRRRRSPRGRRSAARNRTSTGREKTVAGIWRTAPARRAPRPVVAPHAPSSAPGSGGRVADPRIDQRIGDVDRGVDTDEHQCGYHDAGLNHRVVAVVEGVVDIEADTWNRKQNFDDHGAAEQVAEETRGYREHGNCG